MRYFMRGARWLDDHWVGQLIGTASLFALLWSGLVIGHGLGLQ